LGCWRGAFGVCIQFLSLIGVTVQVLGAPRDLLHPELTKHTYFLHFCYRPCPFQQALAIALEGAIMQEIWIPNPHS
jgi:hypothetical protein